LAIVEQRALRQAGPVTPMGGAASGRGRSSCPRPGDFTMRDLHEFELAHVSGAGSSPCPPSKTKNNNGYGNGAESGPAPGNSGATGGGKDENLGPRGPR